MSIDYNTLNYLNFKQNDVEEVSTHSDNEDVYFNVTLKMKECKCPNCSILTNKIKVIKRVSYGYSDFYHLRNRIIYIFNKNASGEKCPGVVLFAYSLRP